MVHHVSAYSKFSLATVLCAGFPNIRREHAR